MNKKWELPKSIIPQSKDKRYTNQVQLEKKFKGFQNPIAGNEKLVGPDPDNPGPLTLPVPKLK